MMLNERGSLTRTTTIVIHWTVSGRHLALLYAHILSYSSAPKYAPSFCCLQQQALAPANLSNVPSMPLFYNNLSASSASYSDMPALHPDQMAVDDSSSRASGFDPSLLNPMPPAAVQDIASTTVDSPLLTNTKVHMYILTPKFNFFST